MTDVAPEAIRRTFVDRFHTDELVLDPAFLAQAVQWFPDIACLTLGELNSRIIYEGEEIPEEAPEDEGDPRPFAEVNTATKLGRKEYDELVLEFISDAGPCGTRSIEIRQELGGTPDQLRKSAHRLIESGQVMSKHKGPRTRYFRVQETSHVS